MSLDTNLEQVIETQEKDEVSYSPAEEKARSQGWVSEEEWVEQGKDPNDWVDCRTFNVRGELFGKIKDLKRELNDYRDVVQELRQHNLELTKKENDSLKAKLRKQKEKAISEGDGKVVAEIDEWMQELNQKDQQIRIPQQNIHAQDITQEFNEWVSKNSWYTSDKELHDEADDIGVALVTRLVQSTGKPLTGVQAAEIYEKVEKKIKRMYPEKFTNPNRSKAPSVAPSSVRTREVGGSTKREYRLVDIPEQYREIAKKFERSGALSVSEYAKQLKEIGVM